MHFSPRTFSLARAIGFLAGLAFLCTAGFVSAQSRDTLLLKFKGRWDNDKLPNIGSQTFSSLWGWTAPDKREYAIMGSLDSIYFIEITPSGKPVLRDVEAARYYRCTNREFKTYKHYAYAIGDQGYSSLQIFDLQYLPDSVHKVYDSTDVCYRAHNLFVDGDRLYLADNKILVPDSPTARLEYYPMSVLSLANPEKPTILAHLEPPRRGNEYIHAEVHDVYVRHDTAWCSAGNAGLFVYDYRDPQNPELLTSVEPPYPYNGYNHSGALSPDGKTFVFEDENHFKRVKIYDARGIKRTFPSLEYLTTVGYNSDLGSVPHNSFIKDSLLYISWYHEGVVIYDIKDPENPKLIGHYDTYPQNDTISDHGRRYDGYQGCWNVYPFFESGNIIASDMTNGLYVLRLEKEIVPDEAWKIKILGNPVKDNTIHLQIASEKPHTLQASLWDITGRMIWNTDARQISAGVQKIDYPAGKDLGNAMYLLRVQTEEGMETFKVLCL